MRRAKKVAVPEEEEEEEMDFDDMDMDELEGGLDGMQLEDLLSPEEIETLQKLVVTVLANDVEEVKKILAAAVAQEMKKEILINAPAPEMGGNNAIMLAFARGQVEMAKLLLENGGEPSTVNEEGDNCFSLACDIGHVGLVELLLEKGLVKLFGPIDDEGNGALHLAARGHVDTLKLLLDKGAFVNVPAGESKATALHVAIMSGRVENVKLLLSKAADVTKVTAAGLTPLMCCVDDDVSNEEAVEIATLLLAAKPEILNKANQAGATAYDLAEANLRYAFARFLLEKGAVPKGLAANTIGVDTFNVTQYYQAGQVPGARTRAASAVVGNTLFVGGGIRCRTAEELELELQGRTDEEIDDISLMPFAPMADIYSTDLTKISVQPLIKDLTKLRSTVASTIEVSKQLKGPHITVNANNTIDVVYEDEDDCCAHDGEGKKKCETEGCEKKDAEGVHDPEHGHEHEHEHEAPEFFTSSVLASENYTAEHSPIAYYEMTVVSAPTDDVIASIGFTSEANEWEFERHPGWTETSVGFHSDDGKARVLEEEEQEVPWVGHPWTVGDVVGAGYIFETRETFFTLNGKFLGVPVSDEDFSGEAIRPVIGVGTNGLKLAVNFGASPFRFNFHVPTVEWTKLNDLPGNYLALFPLPGSTEGELLVIPDSVKTIYHYNPATQQVKVKTTTASKIQGIPLHAEHSVHLLNNKVILFARLEALLDPGKRKTPVFMVLDLNTNVWTDILAPINMNQKKLAKALADTQAQLSCSVINGVYYIFSPDKAYALNLANLSLTATKLAGMLPVEDMGFYPLPNTDGRQLTFTIGPNMTTYRWSLIDMATKQWYVPRFSGAVIEPVVGKSISAFNGKLFSYGGFSSGSTIAKNYFFSMNNASTVSGVGATFNDESKQFFSDIVVKIGPAGDSLKTVHAHKAILAARSETLAALIEKGETELSFPALTHTNSALAVLKYLYTDSIDISLVSAKDYKTVLEAIKAIAPNQEERIVQELLFSRTLARSELNEELSSLGEKYADLTIEANGGSVKAHRVILASRIPALKTLIGAEATSIKVAHSVEAVQQVVNAISLLSAYDLASAPHAAWDEIATLAAEWKVCCLENIIKVAKITFVDPSAAPAAVPQ